MTAVLTVTLGQIQDFFGSTEPLRYDVVGDLVSSCFVFPGVAYPVLFKPLNVEVSTFLAAFPNAKRLEKIEVQE